MVKPKSFRPWNPEQTLLFPPSPVEWLPANHLDALAGLIVQELRLCPDRGCGQLPRSRAPRDLDARRRMNRKLRSKAGQAIYDLSKTIVEPVFGQNKGARSNAAAGPRRNVRHAPSAIRKGFA